MPPQDATTKTLGQSLTEIIVADLSMSLDNVLAVAGAAQGSTWVLCVGLLLRVVLMGVAANLLATCWSAIAGSPGSAW